MNVLLYVEIIPNQPSLIVPTDLDQFIAKNIDSLSDRERASIRSSLLNEEIYTSKENNWSLHPLIKG